MPWNFVFVIKVYYIETSTPVFEDGRISTHTDHTSTRTRSPVWKRISGNRRARSSTALSLLAVNNDQASRLRSTSRHCVKWRRSASSPPTSSTSGCATSLLLGRPATASASGCSRNRPTGSWTSCYRWRSRRAISRTAHLYSFIYYVKKTA